MTDAMEDLQSRLADALDRLRTAEEQRDEAERNAVARLRRIAHIEAELAEKDWALRTCRKELEQAREELDRRTAAHAARLVELRRLMRPQDAMLLQQRYADAGREAPSPKVGREATLHGGGAASAGRWPWIPRSVIRLFRLREIRAALRTAFR